MPRFEATPQLVRFEPPIFLGWIEDPIFATSGEIIHQPLTADTVSAIHYSLFKRQSGLVRNEYLFVQEYANTPVEWFQNIEIPKTCIITPITYEATTYEMLEIEPFEVNFRYIGKDIAAALASPGEYVVRFEITADSEIHPYEVSFNVT